MLEQHEQGLRLECLRLAQATGAVGGEAITYARDYADFVLGRRDAEIVRAASELAETINRGTGNGARAP